MARNKINFITGETYTLAELFSGERRIVIPDLQRDYCWGDNTNRKSTGEVGELVSDFVNNIIEQFELREPGTLNLGLFYGYEIPADHIQLCDGQQRLTTLYLLLGMLNKKTGNFRHHLISDYEYLQDDKEPYLNYAIRETSLYFLSDLVCRFFISNEDKVDAIREYGWYFNEYDLDPSINSMLNALKVIEGILAQKDVEWQNAFGDWLLHKLTFLYFDMETRKNGEETFVVINTTGEPLSATQNMKPLIINANQGVKAVDQKWEEIETWFWKKRNQSINDTADAGFADFLRWVRMIEQKDLLLPDEKQSKDKKEKYLVQHLLKGQIESEFPYKEISFEIIYKYWEALKWIIDENILDSLKFTPEAILSPKANNQMNNRKAVEQKDCFVLLPILKYVYDNLDKLNDGIDVRQVVRVREFFKNLIRIDNVSKSVNTLFRDALKLIDRIDADSHLGTEFNLYPSSESTHDSDLDITSESILDPDSNSGSGSGSGSGERSYGRDVLAILKIEDDGGVEDDTKISRQILTVEERLKLELCRDAEDRNALEEIIWKLQAHEIWNGEIITLINWATEEGVFDFDKFKKYSELFHMLFAGECEHEEKMHLLRRCMILSSDKYVPVQFNMSGKHYYSFGWNWSDWRVLLSRDSTKELFDSLINDSAEDLNKKLENYITTNSSKSEPSAYIEFAKEPYLLTLTKNAGGCDMYKGQNDWQITVSGSSGRHTGHVSRRNALIYKEFITIDCSQYHILNQYDPDSEWKINLKPSNNEKSAVRFVKNENLCFEVNFISSDENGGELQIDLTRVPDCETLSVLTEPESVFDAETKLLKITYDDFDPSAIKSTIETAIAEVDAISKTN